MRGGQSALRAHDQFAELTRRTLATAGLGNAVGVLADEAVGAGHSHAEANPANPNPKETVTWGDQTWEEMMIGWYEAIDVRPKKVAAAK